MTAPFEILIPEESKSIFSSQDLLLVDPSKCPKHIAIIMDGNRRWAKQRGLPPAMGHWEGAEVLTDIVRAASEIGVKTVTVYAFSTENWNRPEAEIDGLMNIFELYLIRKRELMIREGIRLHTIGDISRMSESVRSEFFKSRQATAHCDKINLVLALNYGSRDEIRRAIVKMFKENEEKKIDIEQINESFISKYLDTSPWGDPELLIRTSGELRLSNFLLWQICYTELYITDVLWPDFCPKQLLQSIIEYQSRAKRNGA